MFAVLLPLGFAVGVGSCDLYHICININRSSTQLMVDTNTRRRNSDATKQVSQATRRYRMQSNIC